MEKAQVFYTTKFDEQFQAFEHYKHYPQMMPWVGLEYGNSLNKKPLVVGESHYLPAESDIHHSSESWYGKTSIDLTVEEREWTNTREVISCGENQYWESPGHMIYRNIEYAILGSGFNPVDKKTMFKYFAYYNYFQRPGFEGDSIKHDDKDSSVANEIFENIVTDILRPDVVIFVSMMAFENYMDESGFAEEKGYFYADEEHKIKVYFGPHPGCKYWNTKIMRYCLPWDKQANTGRERFIKVLKKEKIFRSY